MKRSPRQIVCCFLFSLGYFCYITHCLLMLATRLICRLHRNYSMQYVLYMDLFFLSLFSCLHVTCTLNSRSNIRQQK